MKNKKVYYLDGYSPRKGLLGVAAYLYELEDKETEFTRFFMTLDGEWVHEEFWQDIVSVCYTGEAGKGAWWLLGKRGHVYSLGDTDNMEQIARAGTGPGKLGYLRRIKKIDGELYACGLRRQVYKRGKKQWTALDDSILSKKYFYGFRDIDGVSAHNIHAVGYRGEIWYYDSKGWHQADSPTNVDLEKIRYVSPDLCYACGNNGIVLHGYKDQWAVVDNQDTSDLWGLDYFKGKIYLSGFNGLYIIRKNMVEPLNLGRSANGYRLHANNDELWSIEKDEIWVFDGKTWREEVCPNNA
ncbi:MAG: hypothetical protein GY874_22545 [Desulfobacteraceae bacterium]|nr:hypothetical protein [Desulfobacteraceae bacterium]